MKQTCPIHFSVCCCNCIVASYVLSWCVTSLSCGDKDLEASSLDRWLPSQVSVAFDRLVSLQVKSVFYGLSWSETGGYLDDKPASVSWQDGNIIGQVWK